MKAIIVIDLLEEYNLDDLNADVEVSFKDNGQILCGLFNKELKPMPEKRALETRSLMEYVSSSNQRCMGWDDCIDWILGEEDKISNIKIPKPRGENE